MLDALGETTSALASYRRYAALVAASGRQAVRAPGTDTTPSRKRTLESYFLKRADQYLLEHAGERVTVAQLARGCGVGVRTLEKAFADFRGITPIAHARNLRLELAHRSLVDGDDTIAAIAARFGFRSSTTLALEHRKRYGTSPTRVRRTR